MESTYATVYHRSNMTKILFYDIVLFILMLIVCQIGSVYAIEKVIFDTDIGPDFGTGNTWNAFQLYRKILIEKFDSRAVIITTGFITNLATLIISETGDFSALNGLEPVKQKVKRWPSMGGGFPSTGGEFNFNSDAAATFNAFNAEDRTF